MVNGGREAKRRYARRAVASLVFACGLVLLAPSLYVNASVVQRGDLRITLLSQILPFKLPHTGTAPIAVFLAGHVEAVHGGVPDQLQRLSVKVNRHALLRHRGLPVCRVPEVQPASTSRALARCGPAVVGSGQFWAHIVLPDQGAYPTQGRLLVFNGRRNGRPVLLAHIFTSHPFATSFVIVFSIHHVGGSYYGTQLDASLPQALGSWGYVDRIKLTLRRKYRRHGRARSYFNAGCPAVSGANRAIFHLAFATFAFAGSQVGVDVTKTCGVKE